MTSFAPHDGLVRARGRRVFSAALATLALWAGMLAGCAHAPGVYGSPGTSPRPETPWKPPAQAIEKQNKITQAAIEERNASPSIPPALLDSIQNLALVDVVNIALRNSTQTREKWAQALAAAAAYGSARGSLFPSIDANAAVNWQKNAAAGGSTATGYRSYFLGGSLSWLLVDFGGRGGSIEETREALFSANWLHNTAIQDVILEVEIAYYDYSAAKALFAAEQATVGEATTNLNAAEDRHTAGVATIADVLQARTVLSQAQLNLETLEGQIQTTRGVLATAMGLPANTSFDVRIPVGAPPIEEMDKSVEDYLATALGERPDLLAARADALGAAAHLRSVGAQRWPSITASGNAGRLFLNDTSDPNDSYNLAIALSFPLFSGGARHYDVVRAKALSDASRAHAQDVQNLVTLQVWTSYYNLETARQTVRTSDDLLASAAQNHEVAMGRYKAGVGSILDLLTAQALLERARAQRIQARADWWLAVAQLAHDTGTLDVSSSVREPAAHETERDTSSTKGNP